MSASTIIDDTMLPKINKALTDIDTAEKEIALAQRAGLDKLPGGAGITQAASLLMTSKSALMMMKQVYFPGQ